ncbi:hypothetical protein [Mycolicibacterium fluoranthenivorans]|jgi:hypothetical protein|uniref:Uncharacterized protein n=1 Tax=Mycolicibacterium fluoranthenivorans TaxID=258505 RepID=A0A1G4WVU2_9MYCO|nr:hypothetical protein [Mycolicibacterium fluoranthenivorans]SCX30636.1 hypothetical protein SAMN02799620_05119 [Mycolicibacterium fluoranthenivorans]
MNVMTHRSPLLRRTAGGLVLVALAVGSVACSNSEKEAPSTSTTTTTTTTPAPTTSAAPVEPTEKSISPTGGNLFTPTVKAPGPQTAAPGNLPGNSPK